MPVLRNTLEAMEDLDTGGLDGWQFRRGRAMGEVETLVSEPFQTDIRLRFWGTPFFMLQIEFPLCAVRLDFYAYIITYTVSVAMVSANNLKTAKDRSIEVNSRTSVVHSDVHTG